MFLDKKYDLFTATVVLFTSRDRQWILHFGRSMITSQNLKKNKHRKRKQLYFPLLVMWECFALPINHSITCLKELTDGALITAKKLN